MRITVDMDYTTGAEKKRVMDDIETFKAEWSDDKGKFDEKAFTAHIFASVFNGEDYDIRWASEYMVRCTKAIAFPSGWTYGNETEFCFDFQAMGWHGGEVEFLDFRVYYRESKGFRLFNFRIFHRDEDAEKTEMHRHGTVNLAM